MQEIYLINHEFSLICH